MKLNMKDCHDAAAIQMAIDHLALDGGGVVQLPELDLSLDRGLELRSNVELRGFGNKTILRKASSHPYPLSGYINYGMMDVQLLDTKGLSVGMTVSVKDNLRQGFYSTFARITWMDGDWVGLDHGLEADLAAAENPALTTAFPLIFGHEVKNAKITDITLQGNKTANPHAMDGCRGGAVFFLKSHNIEIDGIMESDFNGEGLSFQMCSLMRIRNCSFNGNSGNGMHPGAGSTNVLFENCQGTENGKAGFFFCVRANHVTIRGCSFSKNQGSGVSIGNRDRFNRIENCDISDNDLAGVTIRQDPTPVEVNSCEIRESRIIGNAKKSGDAQIEALGDSHDIVLENNTIDGDGRTTGILTTDNANNIFINSNKFLNCEPQTIGDGFTTTRPNFECGCETTKEIHYRHLKHS